MKKNVAGQIVGADLVKQATPHISYTSTCLVYVTVDDGDQTLGTEGSGVATDKGNGYYTYSPSAAETNGDHIAVTFLGTDSIVVTKDYYTTYPNTVPTNMLHHGYENVTYIKTTDDFTALAEAASSGDLLLLAPGTHTGTAETNVPDGVDIRGPGPGVCTISCDPGGVAASVLSFSGTNTVKGVTVAAIAQGHAVAAATGTDCRLLIENFRLIGQHDVVSISTATTRHYVTLRNGVVDLTRWDGVAFAATECDFVAERVRFFAAGEGSKLGGPQRALTLIANNAVRTNIVVQDCSFFIDSSNSNVLYALNTHADGIVEAHFVNCPIYAEEHLALAETAGIITVIDEGNCGFDQSTFNNTGTPIFTRMNPTAAEGAVAAINEFETQSQANPTGFHVNTKEINSAEVTGDGNATPWNGA